MATSASHFISRPGTQWHEIYDSEGKVRPEYKRLLKEIQAMGAGEVRTLEERMSATLREMGLTFDAVHNDPSGRTPWTCDLLPHVFDGEEWDTITRGFRQRLHAFELFLEDVYGKREILRAGAVPVQTVLGSPHYQRAAIGLPRPRNAYLHLSGLCLARDHNGKTQVRQQHFAHASGISYMLQNRRALARIAPEFFQDIAVHSLAESSLALLEQLREAASAFSGDPTVVLLSPGAGSAISSELSFLARRMGVPMVEGGDLLVLDDCVYLKTVRGLEKVEVIFNRVADSLLDPLVFRRTSLLGVPGLIQCLRKGTVALVNAVGSQLADDRTLLVFSQQIIRFYLGEAPILPTVPTLWLGDIDQREHVLENPEDWRICPIIGDWQTDLFPSRKPEESEAALVAEVKKHASHFVAQPREPGATSLCYSKGRAIEHPLDHIIYAVRTGTDFEILPGALTRAHSRTDTGWTSKDSWVLNEPNLSPFTPLLPRRTVDFQLPPHQVTSRVAEAFYWMGRYLERAHHQAYLISVIETLETEELNSAERKLYRPIWNRLLPPIEKSAGTSRRSIVNPIDRYRLVMLPEPGSVLSAFLRAVANAESVQDSLSPEAWATINHLRTQLLRIRFRENIAEPDAIRVTRKMATFVTQLIPQFFAVSANSMLADDGWRFCEIGQMLERAIITANSLVSISDALAKVPQRHSLHGPEIELSAFLRLLGTRDAYRRIYQMRAEPIHVLELLWRHPQVPRSVLYCLEKCLALLKQSMAPQMLGTTSATAAVEQVLTQIRRIDWKLFVRLPEDDEPSTESPSTEGPTHKLQPLLKSLLGSTLDLHSLISDSFLNHQARIAQVSQPQLRGII